MFVPFVDQKTALRRDMPINASLGAMGERFREVCAFFCLEKGMLFGGGTKDLPHARSIASSWLGGEAPPFSRLAVLK